MKHRLNDATGPDSPAADDDQKAFWGGADELRTERRRWNAGVIAGICVAVVVLVLGAYFFLLRSPSVPTQANTKLPGAAAQAPAGTTGHQPVPPLALQKLPSSQANCTHPADEPVAKDRTPVLWWYGRSLPPSSTDAIKDFNPATTPGKQLATLTWVISPYVKAVSFRYSVWVNNGGCAIINVVPGPHQAARYGTTNIAIGGGLYARSLNLKVTPGTVAWVQFALVPGPNPTPSASPLGAGNS